jgi:hypothetical protein
MTQLKSRGGPNDGWIVTSPVKRGSSFLTIRLGIIVCPAALGHRAAFNDAGALGLTAQEYDPNGKGGTETKDVYKFVSKLINSSTHKGVKNHGIEGRRLTKRHAG